MTAETNIRMADEADLPALARIWHDGWIEGEAVLYPDVAVSRDLAFFSERIGANLPRMIVAETDDAIVGFASWEENGVDQLFVSPAYFGKGVAPRLLATVEAILKAEGRKKIWLHCAFGNNRARRFYEKHGWTVTREFDVEIGSNRGPLPVRAWHLEKVL